MPFITSPKSLKSMYCRIAVARGRTISLEILLQVDFNKLIYTMWSGESIWSPYYPGSNWYFFNLVHGKIMIGSTEGIV